jgi:hypothetical protein
MDLENTTSFPAAIYRGMIDAHRLWASVLARVTYSLEGGRLRVAEQQSWKISSSPWDCEYGPMEPDELFRKGGVDLLIFGSARAPGDRPAPRIEVSASVGQAFRRTLTVWGPRVWTRGSAGLVASDPQPVAAVPLTLGNAFGGKDVWDELEIPFPDNPAGTGFYLEEASAAGRPLASIEDPTAPVRRWDDRPEPVGVGPCNMGFGPRLRRSLRFDEQSNQLAELKPTFFNAAFPDMIVPRVEPGERVRVTGVRPDGPLEFVVPPVPLAVRVRFGEERDERLTSIDQIGIEPDRNRVFISYRFPFRYRMNPLQARSCRLVAREAA